MWSKVCQVYADSLYVMAVAVMFAIEWWGMLVVVAGLMAVPLALGRSDDGWATASVRSLGLRATVVASVLTAVALAAGAPMSTYLMVGLGVALGCGLLAGIDWVSSRFWAGRSQSIGGTGSER